MMPETRFTEGWDFSVCIGERCLRIFLTYDIKMCYLLSVISFIFDILRRLTTFANVIQCSRGGAKVTSLLKFRVLM